jgi:imidazoleglycerol-phosphate dehydratase
MQTQDRSLTQSMPNGAMPSRRASVSRTTGETDVQVSLNLDGTGTCHADTGIPFLDHMLHQISSHGLIDLEVQAKGDLEIDDHHTNEDVGITLGMALHKALGDRKGITRFGHFVAPLDEALIQVALDFSGRPHLAYGLQIPTERVGNYDTQLVREFFVAVVNHSQMTPAHSPTRRHQLPSHHRSHLQSLRPCHAHGHRSRSSPRSSDSQLKRCSVKCATGPPKRKTSSARFKGNASRTQSVE